MSNVIGEALIVIRPETTGFAEQTQRGVLGAAKSIAVGVAGVFAAEKLFSFGKSALQDAADVQKANQAVRFEYGKSAESIQRFAQHSAANLGISTQTAITTASAFGILFKNVGIGHEKAAEMTVGFEKLAGSLSLIKNASPAQSMSALTTAIAGNTRGLRQLGIVVTPVTELMYAASHGIINVGESVKAATVKANAAQTTFTQTVDKYGKNSQQAALAQAALVKAQDAVSKAAQGQGAKLTPAQKAMAIYGLATQNLSKYQEEARKHSGNLADQEEILRAKFDNLKVAIGQHLLPVATTLVKVLISDVVPAIEKWSRIIGNALQPYIQSVTGFLRDHAGTLRDVAKAAAIAVPVIGGLAIAVGILAGAFALLTSPVTLIIALGTAAVYAYQHWKPFRDVVNEVAGYLQKNALPAFRAVRNYVMTSFVPSIEAGMHNFAKVIQTAIFVAEDFWNRFGATIKNVLTILKLNINVFLDVIHGHWGNALSDMLNIASNIFHAIVNVINGFTGGAATKIGQAASGMFHSLVHGIAGMPGAVSGILGRIVGALLSFGFSAGNLLYNAGVAIMQSLLNGLLSLWGRVQNFIGGVASWISSHKGPLDADRQLLVPHGKAIMAGLHEGLQTGLVPVTQLVAGVAPAIAGSIGAQLGGMQGGVHAASGPSITFGPGSIIVNGATDPAKTARAILDEAAARVR